VGTSDSYDVIVAGGGASGLIAGIAAARQGVRTLIIERAACFGGTATSAYVAQYVGFFNGNTQAVWGAPYELTRRVTAAGGGAGFDQYTMGEAAGHPTLIRNFPFNPEVVKMIADEMVVEAGVDALFHTLIAGVVSDGTQVKGLVVEGVGGRREIAAKVVIDATGDAVVAKHAGVALAGEEEELRNARQPQTLMFRLSNVDLPRFRALPRDQKRSLVLEGLKSGELYWESLSFTAVPGTTDVTCFMSRIQGLDALNDDDLTTTEMVGRKQIRTIIPFLQRRVPGFERCHLSGIAARAGIRETRRIDGQYVLTGEDVMAARSFPDSIALGCGPVDLHDATSSSIYLRMPPAPFEIPMRCLLPKTVEGIIVTGRAISATREANGGARHMATAMALGEAAGVMSAVSISEGCTTLEIPAELVRARLRKSGAAVTAADCARLSEAQSRSASA
jgi:hypothetical protein